MRFAIKESIQNAFVHGSKANPNYPIFIRLNISEDNQLLSTEIYNALSDEFDAKALEKARKANLFGAGEGEKGIKEVVGLKREELKDEAGSIIGTKVTLVPFDIQKERARGALSMRRQSAYLVMEAKEALPQEWREYDLKAAKITAELARLLQIENLLNQDKSTFIFSEKVTFDNGFGVLLPKIAKSGMRVAVIATNDRQRALIDELNQGQPEDKRIIYADTIAEVRTAEAKKKIYTARYYYFKVTGDPDTDLRNVTTFDITEIVKKIIDALGKLSGIIERERLELLHEAARRFAESA